VVRLPRDQTPGIYHVTDRGTGPSLIFRDEDDHESLIGFLSRVLEEFDWTCHVLCLLGTHYHLVIQTAEENLAAGMQRLKELFAQGFNKRHGRVGALFQGRYGSFPVLSDAHLLAVIRYVALNPVKAAICESPRDWRWSSYSVLVGAAEPFPFPVGEELLGLFGSDRASAIDGLVSFVEAPLWDTSVRRDDSVTGSDPVTEL
jgi:REP element-mobilizing transposase RayT